MFQNNFEGFVLITKKHSADLDVALTSAVWM